MGLKVRESQTGGQRTAQRKDVAFSLSSAIASSTQPYLSYSEHCPSTLSFSPLDVQKGVFCGGVSVKPACPVLLLRPDLSCSEE